MRLSAFAVKFLPMKTILSGILLLFIACSTQGQNFDQWTDPIPLTDSLTDNNNPFLLRMEYPSPMKLMMVWEKSIDTLSTSIFLDNILDTISEELLLADLGIHYTNPQIMYSEYWFPSDTLLYLFYETDQNGNQDIYFMTYSIGGVLSAPVAFANSQDDEEQLSVGHNEFWDGNKDNYLSSISWICNGNLYVRNYMIGEQGYYFGENILIDSNYCNDPSINNQNDLIYTKSDSSSSKIMKSTCDYTGTWSNPQLVYEETDALNPTTALHYFTPCWSANQDSLWTIMLNNTGNIYNISSDNPLDPTALGMIMGEEGFFSTEVYIAITKPDNGFNEIFMNPEPFSHDFENFTNSGTMNQNPQFFMGESEGFLYHWWDYLVWESLRNGNWQIWSSKIFNGYSDIKEFGNGTLILSTHPNPFTHETTLEFTLDTRNEVAIEVYDNRGMLISTIADQSFDQGTHQLRWDGGGLAAGIYIIEMTVGDMVYTAKVVKSP